MSKPALQIPDEALFFIADQYIRVDDLLRYLYDRPSANTSQHFKSINAHLKGGSVQPGQMVIITPANPSACTQWESVMMEAAAKVDEELAKMSERERRNLARHYSFLSDAADHSGTLYGFVNGHFAEKRKRVEQILKSIDELYVSTYNRNGSLKGSDFFTQRRALFMQLDHTINGMMEQRAFGYDVSHSRLRTQLGLSSKAAVHQWKMQGGATSVREFANNYSRIAKTAKAFSRLGYVAIALDVGSGAAKIKAACTAKPGSEECEKIKFTETGRVAGSVAGGAASGALAAWATCSLVFGLPSGGTSLLWCSIVAGGVGGYGGSKAAGKYGESFGEELYRRTIHLK